MIKMFRIECQNCILSRSTYLIEYKEDGEVTVEKGDITITPYSVDGQGRLEVKCKECGNKVILT